MSAAVHHLLPTATSAPRGILVNIPRRPLHLRATLPTHFRPKSVVGIGGAGLSPIALGRRRCLAGALVAMAFSAQGSAPSSPEGSKEEEFIKKAVSSHEVVIFSKSYCPYCMETKGLFKELQKVPHVIELDERDDGADIQDVMSRLVGRSTVPQVFVNGKHVGGCDDTVDAYETGTLQKLLN